MVEPAHDGDAHFQRLVRDVDTFGWHVVLVPADELGPGFAYTVGVNRTLKLPEIIMIGLRLEVMHPVINGIVGDMKKGKRFEPGKPYADVIEGFNCVFRPVQGSHYDEYVGQAIRFYGNSTFPVLQCIWPDKAGRFPWDKDASAGLGRQQPLLDTPWPFKDVRNVATITTRQVIEDGRPIVLVTHDEEDGGWQFLCDTAERGDADGRVVSLQCMFDRDPSVGELADLPLGWRASREKPGSPWRRETNEPND